MGQCNAAMTSSQGYMRGDSGADYGANMISFFFCGSVLNSHRHPGLAIVCIH